MRTIAEINHKINQGQVVAWTVEELKAKVAEIGIAKAFCHRRCDLYGNF